MITVLLSQLSNPPVKILLNFRRIFLVVLAAYFWALKEVNDSVHKAEQKLIQQYQNL